MIIDYLQDNLTEESKITESTVEAFIQETDATSETPLSDGYRAYLRSKVGTHVLYLKIIHGEKHRTMMVYSDELAPFNTCLEYYSTNPCIHQFIVTKPEAFDLARDRLLDIRLSALLSD